MNPEQQPSTKPIVQTVEEDDEIDLMAIAKTIWSGRKTIIISILIGAILGVFIAIQTPNEYTASTIMVPQTGSKNQSGLSSLASLAGVDIGMAENAELSPVLYPKIVNSIPFKLELMNTKVTFSNYDKPITLCDYYSAKKKPSLLGIIRKYTIGLPGVVLGMFKKAPQELTLAKETINQPINLTRKQYEVKKALDACISLVVEKKEGYLTLFVRMPEALAAAQIAKKSQELLQRDITRFKIEKSKANLKFIQERYDVAKVEAEGYQVNIAANTDRYKNLTSNIPQVNTTRIQTKYGIANNVYQELAKQLEQAKIQVKKDTPVFTIIEPVSVPLERSNPKRSKILFVWIFIGSLTGVCIVFGKKYFALFKEKWND